MYCRHIVIALAKVTVGYIITLSRSLHKSWDS